MAVPVRAAPQPPVSARRARRKAARWAKQQRSSEAEAFNINPPAWFAWRRRNDLSRVWKPSVAPPSVE